MFFFFEITSLRVLLIKCAIIQVAYIWEGNEPNDSFKITYNELHSQVVNFSAVLRGHGVKKGDVVALYLPMITELAVAMLACTRIGAMHSVVFAGFSASALGARIIDANGSTGKPKGIQHSTAGYMVYAYYTTKCTFDAHPEKDVYWCTADCGWITGHTYLLYGPLMNGLTGIWFEGVPTHPAPDRMWAVTDKYKVNKLYTSPTAIRALMAMGDDYVTKHSRASLEILGTVGEPINPAAWK
ncbi:unnamed protein product, partial [Strongylus vulgaris]